MKTSREFWVVVADRTCARLLRGTATRHAQVHLDEVANLRTDALVHEHERPTRMSQPGRAGPFAQGHELEVDHFARQIGTWLEAELPARSIGQCQLFAPTHLIGALRRSLGPTVTGKVTEHAGELAQMSLDALSRHPEIATLLPA